MRNQTKSIAVMISINIACIVLMILVSYIWNDGFILGFISGAYEIMASLVNIIAVLIKKQMVLLVSAILQWGMALYILYSIVAMWVQYGMCIRIPGNVSEVCYLGSISFLTIVWAVCIVAFVGLALIAHNWKKLIVIYEEDTKIDKIF